MGGMATFMWPLSGCTGDGGIHIPLLDGCLADDEAQEVVVNDAHSLIYEVTVEAGQGARVGLELDFVAEREVLPVRGIRPNSVMHSWNKTEPVADHRVVVGDRLLSVNGTRGSKAMLEAIRKTGSLTLSFVRLLGGQLEEEDDIYVAAYNIWLEKKPAVVAATSSRPKVPVLPFGNNASLGQQPSQTQELPAPWRRVWSNKKHRLFFHNPETNQSQWFFPGTTPGVTPATSMTGLTSASPTEVGGDPNAGLPPGWQAVWSITRHKYYYHNGESNRNMWKRPTASGGGAGALSKRPMALAPPAPPSQPPTPSVQSHPLKSPGTPETPHATVNIEAKDSDGELAEGWQVVFSKSRGKHYYHCVETGENAWQRPLRQRGEPEPLDGAEPVTGPITSTLRMGGSAGGGSIGSSTQACDTQGPRGPL